MISTPISQTGLELSTKWSVTSARAKIKVTNCPCIGKHDQYTKYELYYFQRKKMSPWVKVQNIQNPELLKFKF